MNDKRIVKVKQHFDVFLNNQKLKVITCNINETEGILSIKTKIFGQNFPHNGHFTIAIPSHNIKQDLSIEIQSMYKDSAIEHWKYTIKKKQVM